MATSLTFLTPLGALVLVGVLVPLGALLAVRRRAERVRGTVGLPPTRLRRLLAPLAALLATGGLFALAAAQPVLERTSTLRVRTDAEAFVVLDVSRSMLAQADASSPMRIERAKAAASELRARLADVPFGVASLTDRVMPHLFPSANGEVFHATLDRSLGIERPPPRGSFLTNATDFNALAKIRDLRFFSPDVKRRLVVVVTDGESVPVATARLAAVFRRPPGIDLIFVHVWDEDERVFTQGVPEPEYEPDPSSRELLERIAVATGGALHPESSVGAAVRNARRALGSGPTAAEGQVRGRDALAPFLALAAFLPLGLLLWRRDR
jgi:hypothetical protein